MSATFWILSATLILAPASVLRRRRGVIEMAAIMACSLPLCAWIFSQLSLAPPIATISPSTWIASTESPLNWLAWIWMTGVLFTGSRLLIGLVTLWRWRQQAVPLDPLSIHKIAALLNAPTHDVETYVRISEAIQSPMVVPGWPSRVLLPKDWYQWKEDLQSASLHHEWHHLKQRDGWRTLALAIFSAVWWFHPLALWLRQCWQEQTEFEADEAAARRSNPERYATALLDFASSNRRRAMIPVLSVGFALSNRKRFQYRIEAILDSEVRSPTHPFSQMRNGWFAVSLICLTAFLSWSGCYPSPPRADFDAQNSEARIRLTADPFPADR